MDMMALPKKFKSNSKGGGVIQDTASSSSLVALLTAREKASKGKTNEKCSRDRSGWWPRNPVVPVNIHPVKTGGSIGWQVSFD